MTSSLSNELFYTAYRGLKVPPHQVNTDAVGVHFSADKQTAQQFANAPRTFGKGATVLHAEIPASSVETNTDALTLRGFAGFNGKDPLNEQEIPVKSGAPVKVTARTKFRHNKKEDGQPVIKTRTRRYNPPREMKA